MDKEREPKFESGFSEKQLDLVVDQVKNSDPVKAGNIFVASKKTKKSPK